MFVFLANSAAAPKKLCFLLNQRFNIFLMNFKIDTKEKFQEIYLLEQELTANMTDKLSEMLHSVSKTTPANVILCMEAVAKMDNAVALLLNDEQSRWYEQDHSFVICQLQPQVEAALEDAGILENMNTAPTLSEAWDLVQMEEIERELLDE